MGWQTTSQEEEAVAETSCSIFLANTYTPIAARHRLINSGMRVSDQYLSRLGKSKVDATV